MAMSDQRRAHVRELCDAAVAADAAYGSADAAVEAAKAWAEECRVKALNAAKDLRAYIGQTVVVHRGQLVATPAGNDYLVVRAVESVEVLDAGLPGPVGEPEPVGETEVPGSAPAKGKKGKAKGQQPVEVTTHA